MLDKTKPERPLDITLVVSTETIRHSMIKDAITLAWFTVGFLGPVIINELTLRSAFINFVCLMMLLSVWVVRLITLTRSDRIIRGGSVDDIIRQLPERVAEIERRGWRA